VRGHSVKQGTFPLAQMDNREALFDPTMRSLVIVSAGCQPGLPMRSGSPTRLRQRSLVRRPDLPLIPYGDEPPFGVGDARQWRWSVRSQKHPRYLMAFSIIGRDSKSGILVVEGVIVLVCSPQNLSDFPRRA
jgi:hypothetical protein